MYRLNKMVHNTPGLCQIHPLHLSCQFPIECTGSSSKESACNAGDTGDMSSIPGSRRSPGGEMATRASIFAWNILWTEELGGLQTTGSQRVGHDWAHTCYVMHCLECLPYTRHGAWQWTKQASANQTFLLLDLWMPKGPKVLLLCEFYENWANSSFHLKII